jgi:hypothetical protein
MSRELQRMLRAARAVRPRLLVAIGGGLLAMLLALVLVHGRTSSTPAAAATAVRDLQPETPAAPRPVEPASELIVIANELVEVGRDRDALDLLTRARHEYPDAASIPFAIGRIYFSRMWWNDGLENFRIAIRLEPSYATDPALIEIVLEGFATTPSANHDLSRFIRDDLGDAAIPRLEEMERDHPNPIVRTRAGAELRRIRGAARF